MSWNDPIDSDSDDDGPSDGGEVAVADPMVQIQMIWNQRWR